MKRRELLAEAEAIGRELEARQRPTADGTTWIGPSGYGTELLPLTLVQLGPHLYDGTTGVALFLAALARATGADRFRATSLRAVAPLCRKVRDLASDPERANRLGLAVGGLIGIGSFVYGLLRIGELLDEPDLVEVAHQATELLTAERIAHDRQPRVQTGSAGAILALLALQERVPYPNARGATPLDLAVLCGKHLLAERISWEGRPLAWALSPGKPPLAGFSYGAGGISVALFRLAAATGDGAYADAAAEGMAFVDCLYAPEHRGWRDVRTLFERLYRPRRGTWLDWWAQGTLDDLDPRREEDGPASGEDRYLDMWCHGSYGIVLGRIGAGRRPEIDPALDQVLARLSDSAFEEQDDGSCTVDDLCCGATGKVETLLEAGRRLGDPSLTEAAHRLMDRVCEQAKRRGRFELSAARGSDHFAPSLFQGIAGVGYTLLRLAMPDEMPSVLLLDRGAPIDRIGTEPTIHRACPPLDSERRCEAHF